MGYTRKTAIDRQPRKHRSDVSRSRRLIIPLLIVLVALTLVQAMRGRSSSSSVHYAYQGGSQSFVGQLSSGKVQSVIVNTAAQTIEVKPTSGPTYTCLLYTSPSPRDGLL